MKTPPSAPAVSSRRRAAAGFTLIELLTVIAIIGILAAIIIPTVGKVRQTARNSTCTSNLRQIGTAIFLAAAENRNRFPAQDGVNANDPTHVAANPLADSTTTENWVRAIASHVATREKQLASVLNCPSVFPEATTGAPISYAMNGWLVNQPINAVKSPTKTVLVRHTTPRNESVVVAGDAADLRYEDGGNRFEAGDATSTRSYSYLFADGHVSRIKIPPALAKDEYYNYKKF